MPDYSDIIRSALELFRRNLGADDTVMAIDEARSGDEQTVVTAR